MRTPIQDEFTQLPLSRQRKYQLRCQRDRLCTECGQPVAGGTRCLEHLIKARERQRKSKGLKRRYHGTLSYRLEAALSSGNSLTLLAGGMGMDGPQLPAAPVDSGAVRNVEITGAAA